jgi:hypothetical protein
MTAPTTAPTGNFLPILAAATDDVEVFIGTELEVFIGTKEFEVFIGTKEFEVLVFIDTEGLEVDEESGSPELDCIGNLEVLEALE